MRRTTIPAKIKELQAQELRAMELNLVGAKKCGGESGLHMVAANLQWGFINAVGTVIIPLQFDDVYDFSEGRARAKVGENWGYIKPKGRFAIQPQFFQSEDAPVPAKEFSEGLAAVMVQESWGFIDASGQTKIQPQFVAARSFSEGLASVLIEDMWGYIDHTGRSVIRPQFSTAHDFAEGRAWVEMNGQYGYIDPVGNLIIPAHFPMPPRNFAEGLAGADGDNRKMGFIDKAGNWAIPPQFDWVGDFSEGLAPFAIFENPIRMGFIDRTGTIQIPATFSDTSGFSEGIAVTSSTGPNPRIGYIDKMGNVLFQLGPTVVFSYDFCGGLAYVLKHKTNAPGYMGGYINTSGRYVWAPRER